MPSPLPFRRAVLGCDPEMFFKHGERILGAEKILPLTGLEYQVGTEAGGKFLDGQGADHTIGTVSRVIIDGVQAELNPRPSDCRARLVSEISALFRKLKDHLKSFNGVGVDFSQTVQLSEEDFEELPENAKKFGCMPSKNANDGGKESSITVDPSVYRYRSAGGHIHMGRPLSQGENYDKMDKVLKDPERLIRMMDILVGNTCVLLDRDPGNVERRKVYGRAGEFRTPPHGVEYRTLSNFWLRHPVLASLVFGLAREAMTLVAEDKDKLFVDAVSMSDIADAINTNDYVKALANFEKIKPLITEFVNHDGFVGDAYHPLNSASLELFRHFYEKGIGHWFTEDPLDVWTKMDSGYNNGFEKFLGGRVAEDMGVVAGNAVVNA